MKTYTGKPDKKIKTKFPSNCSNKVNNIILNDFSLNRSNFLQDFYSLSSYSIFVTFVE